MLFLLPEIYNALFLFLLDSNEKKETKDIVDY